MGTRVSPVPLRPCPRAGYAITPPDCKSGGVTLHWFESSPWHQTLDASVEGLLVSGLNG